jgi:hypothetical protein
MGRLELPTPSLRGLISCRPRTRPVARSRMAPRDSRRGDGGRRPKRQGRRPRVDPGTRGRGGRNGTRVRFQSGTFSSTASGMRVARVSVARHAAKLSITSEHESSGKARPKSVAVTASITNDHRRSRCWARSAHIHRASTALSRPGSRARAFGLGCPPSSQWVQYSSSREKPPERLRIAAGWKSRRRSSCELVSHCSASAPRPPVASPGTEPP